MEPEVANSIVLEESLASLARALQEVNEIGRDRERIIDRLHEENRRLKEGELRKALEPICRDLVRLYDELEKAPEMSYFKDQVCDMLFRHFELEVYSAECGQAVFDPSEHKALRAVPTDDPEQNRRVARVLRQGFRTTERVFRALEVEVYRLSEGGV